MDFGNMMQEGKMTSYMFSKACARKLPLSGAFELSPVCNMSCKMCYIKKTIEEVRNSPRAIMKLNEWIALAEQLREQGMLYLLLTGGEPFLWPDFWQLYEKLTEMGFLISINSNGTLIDNRAIDKLKQRPPTRINITIYGAHDATYEKLCGTKGAFSKVDHAVTGLIKAGIPVKLNCSLSPANAGDLERIVQYAEEKNLILDVATYMFPPVRRDNSCIGENERFTPHDGAYYDLKRYRLQYGEEKYQQYLNKIVNGSVFPPGVERNYIDPADGRLRCRAGKASFWITWDGWLTPCGFMSSPCVDVHQYGFEDAWKLLTEECEGLVLSGICSRCANQGLCHACAAMAIAETGSIERVPLCLCRWIQETREIAEKELADKKEF